MSRGGPICLCEAVAVAILVLCIGTGRLVRMAAWAGWSVWRDGMAETRRALEKS